MFSACFSVVTELDVVCFSHPRSGSAGRERGRRRLFLYADPRINNDSAVGEGHYRIEVHFGDLRMVLHQCTYPKEQVLNRPHVGHWGSSKALEHWKDPKRTEHVLGVAVREGSDSDSDVLRQLDCDSACPAGQDGSEEGIVHDTNDELYPRRHHLLDEKALQLMTLL